ncbi:MAG: zf-HC2 domain-containing protein [Myxococcota bacterium]|nr:zf-HC2 domain-containing protein [Myxococcota bacterium]
MGEMNRATCPPNEDISAFLDGDMADADTQAIAAHLEGCDACTRAADEMSQITSGLALLGDEQVPDYVWGKIQAVQRERAAASWSARFSAWWASWWRVPTAVAAGGAACAVALFLIISNDVTTTPTNNTLNHARALMGVTDAEQVYMKAIGELEQSLDETPQDYSPEARQAIAASLADMDAAIERVRRVIEKNPNDVAAHQTALLLYRQKVDLLTDLVVPPL